MRAAPIVSSDPDSVAPAASLVFILVCVRKYKNSPLRVVYVYFSELSRDVIAKARDREPKSRRFVALAIRDRLSFNGGRVARAGEAPEKRGEKKSKNARLEVLFVYRAC